MKQSVSSLSQLYESLTVTAKKVNDLLVHTDAQSMNEERVYGYLTTMIGNMNINELRSFLRFVTESTVCNSTKILVTFNSSTGLASRPLAHTCEPTLDPFLTRLMKNFHFVWMQCDYVKHLTFFN